MSRTTRLVLILVLVAIGAWVLLRRPPPSEDSILSADGLELLGHHANGTPAWRISATSGTLDAPNGILEEVELTFYDAGDEAMRVYGDRLSRNSSGSTLSGDVIIEQPGRSTLRTEQAFWDEGHDILEAGAIELEFEDGTLEAGSFHHDLSSDRSVLSQGIDVQLIRAQETVRATAQSAEFEDQQFRLLGDVEAVSGSATELRARQLTYRPSDRSLQFTHDVEGRWENMAFSSTEAHVTDEGFQLRGNVIVDLDLTRMTSHDS